jgi:hypothetical protein
VAVAQDEWGPLTPPAAPSAGGEWGPLTPPAPARAAAPARQPAAAPQQPVDPGYPETYNPAPGLIATTPGRARTGPGSYRGTSDDPVPLDNLSPEQIFNLPPGIFVRYPSGEIDQFSRVNPNAGATPTRIERGAQRQYGVLPADEREGPRTLGERFTSTFENLVNEGIPASVGRFVVGAADRSGYRTDPATGERYYVADVGQLTRNAERARRFNFAQTTQGDEWYRQQGLVNQMLAGGTTLAGVLAGGATDPSNYFGGLGKNILTRATGNFGFGAAQDVALQGLDIGSGVQEGYDPGRTLIAGGLNAAIPLGVEGAGRVYNRFAPNGTPELYGPPAPDGVGPARQPSTLPDVEVTGTRPERAGLVSRQNVVAGAREDVLPPEAVLTGEVTAEGPRAAPRGYLWDTPVDDLRRMREEAGASDNEKLVMALGEEGAAEFKRLDRARNSMDPQRADAAGAEFDARFGNLTPDQERLVYGIGEDPDAPSVEDLDALIRAHSDVMPGDAPEDAAYMAAVGARNIDPDGIDAVMRGEGTPAQQAAFVRLQNARDALAAQGIPDGEIPARMARALVDRGGWKPEQANEIIGGFMRAFEARAAGPRAPLLEAPDDFGPLRPPETRTLAEDVGAPGRTPDEVLPGSVVRALDDEFGIPPQPSPAVARAAEADLTLRAPAADRADPDLVGNIRLSNLNSEQDIARVLETARAAGGDFVEARRGTQTFDDIEALAADLDMTADTLIKRRAGQAFNAEEIRRARGLLVASAERVDDLARQIDEAVEPGDALNTDFREAILRHVAIQEQVAGISAEAGRALGAMRMLANSDNITPEMLASVLGGGMDVKGAARAIRQAGTRNPKARARAIKAAIKPTFTDMLVEYWYNSILSGPATHIVNVLSNTLTALNQLPEFAAAAAIGGARRALNIGPSERVLGTEVGQRAVGMVSGAVEGARAFADTLATGNVSDGVTKMEVAQQRAIPGVLGTVVRTPGRFLAAEDELFKAIARRMQINGLATRIAHQEGLRGEAAVARAAELSANPTKEMMDEADNYARYITFQDPMGRIGRGVMQVTSGAPILKLVVPFVRTPINLMKQTVERSPFAFVLKSWREDVRAGGVRGDLALAKAAVGSGYGLAIALAAQQGNITGAAPTDRAEREALLATGWQPFSLKIGDNYYSYRRLDPLGTLVGIAATMGQPHLFAGEREGAEKRFVVGFLAMLSDKTFMSGISDLVAAVDDPSGRRAEAYINRLMGSVLVPFSAAVSQTAKALDPTSRMAENIPDVLRSRIPGMSQDLPARYDVLGREMRTSPGGFEAFSPVTRAPVRDDPVANMILESGVRITPPNRTIKGTRLSAEAYSQYQAEAGAQIRNNMAWYMENPQVWNSMSKEERAEETKRQVDRARETARQNLGLSQ